MSNVMLSFSALNDLIRSNVMILRTGEIADSLSVSNFYDGNERHVIIGPGSHEGKLEIIVVPEPISHVDFAIVGPLMFKSGGVVEFGLSNGLHYQLYQSSKNMPQKHYYDRFGIEMFF